MTSTSGVSAVGQPPAPPRPDAEPPVLSSAGPPLAVAVGGGTDDAVVTEAVLPRPTPAPGRAARPVVADDVVRARADLLIEVSLPRTGVDATALVRLGLLLLGVGGTVLLALVGHPARRDEHPAG